MTQGEGTVLRVARLFLLAQFLLVHCPDWVSPGLSQPAKQTSDSTRKQQSGSGPGPEIRYGSEGLPAPVQDMCEAILSAVKSGRIDELRHAWEFNELKPDLGVASVGDPIAH